MLRVTFPGEVRVHVTNPGTWLFKSLHIFATEGRWKSGFRPEVGEVP